MNKTLYRHICTKVQLDILWHPGKVFWRCELHKTECKELHLLVRQLRSRALNTNIHQIRHQIERDLLRRTNGSQHYLSDLRRGNTACQLSLLSLHESYNIKVAQ